MAGQTHIGATLAIAVTSDPTVPDPQNTDLSASEFAALTYEDVPNLGTHGDTGVDQNIVTFPIWDRALAEQQKGAATGAQSEMTFLDVASDGLTAMKAAAGVTEGDNFALRITYSNGDIEYNRGVISAASFGKGENEAFRTVTFTMAANQEVVQA